MKTMKTEVPEGTDEVTLVIRKAEKTGKPTLGDVLPLVQGDVEVFVWSDYRIEFDKPVGACDGVNKSECWSAYAANGNEMLAMLKSSKVVDGVKLLGLTPFMKSEAPVATLTNGSTVLSGNSRVTLHVRV